MLPLSWLDAAEDEEAGEAELAARELAAAAGLDAQGSGRHDTPPQLVSRLCVDDWYPGVQKARFAEDAAPTDARALGDHAAAADETVVLDDHRRGLRGLEYSADPHPARE